MTSVKRYENVTHDYAAKGEYVIPHSIKCERVVDDSNFVPESEILKKLDGARQLSDPEIRQLYDFADGKDKGTPIPFNRTAENLDIAILSKEIRDNLKELGKQVREAEATSERQLQRELKAKAAINETNKNQ